MSHDFPFEHFLPADDKTVEPISSLNKYNLKVEQNNTFSDNELNVMNEEIVKSLKSSLPHHEFDTFFNNSFFLKSIINDTVEFTTTTLFIKNTIQNHYLDKLKIIIVSMFGKEYKINLSIFNNGHENSLENPISANSTSHANQPKTANDVKFTLDLTSSKDDLISKVESQYIDHMNPSQMGLLIDPDKTFDNFIIGPSNNMAFATAYAVSKDPGKSGKYPSLYIHSDSGLGKTHLLYAVANGIKDKYPHLTICLITARDFMKEMINAIQMKNLPAFQKKYSSNTDVLMIDDIHELKNKPGTQNEFFHIFNELHNKGKQLIFTSDKSPKEIDGIEERVKTRLQWGLVVDIQKPDLETRIAILKRKAYELDLFLTDDVLNLIASFIKTNIRELEGSLIKLSAYSDLMKVEIDIVMVKNLLSLDANNENLNVITLDHIAKSTAQYFKIPLADLKSKARDKDIAFARHVAMYLSRKILRTTQKEIGKFYGGRDHTSVIHGVNKITDQLKTDLELSRQILQIENNL